MKNLIHRIFSFFRWQSPEERELIGKLKYYSSLPPLDPCPFETTTIAAGCITAAKIDTDALRKFLKGNK